MCLKMTKKVKNEKNIKFQINNDFSLVMPSFKLKTNFFTSEKLRRKDLFLRENVI